MSSIDLTTAHYFLSGTVHIAKVVSAIQRHMPDTMITYNHTCPLLLHVVVKQLLLALHGLYQMWRQKTLFTDADVRMYSMHVDTLQTSLGWKPTVWVHWTCAHSLYYAERHRNIYAFSSLPTERRHQTFKLDLRHAFQGWKLASPVVASRFLRCVVEQDALDLSLSTLPPAKRAR